MKRRRLCGWLSIVPVLLGGLSCRDSAPVAGTPLTQGDREQFERPLLHASWSERGSWPQFSHDPLHTGHSDVDLVSVDLQPAWRFKPSEHVWAYEEGNCVWSPAVAGTVAGRTLVIAGHYDRIVYAVDGRTGEKAWEFRPGTFVFASPALGVVDGQPRVFVAAANRSVYALDAATGQQAWVFEATPWTFTEVRSVMSSPTVVNDGREAVLVVGVWTADRSASHNVQSGELIALRAADGTPRWRKRLGTVPVSSPAVVRLNGQFVCLAASRHGVLYALRMDDGELLWKAVLNEETRSSPSVGCVDGCGVAFIGTRLHSLFGLDLVTGGRRWRRLTGYWIDATPAHFADESLTTVVAGSYDRRFHAFAAGSGEPCWHTETGNYAYSSCATAQLAGDPVVIGMSWDDRLYLLDGRDGRVLWKVASGPLLWSHAFQGDSLWASPSVVEIDGRPTILFPAYDGVLYAYQSPIPSPSPQQPQSTQRE